MTKYIVVVALCVLAVGNGSLTCYGDDLAASTMKKETKGIHVTKAQFAQLVTECVQDMEQNKTLTNQTYIKLVRVYNTIIRFPRNEVDDGTDEFIKLFVPLYLNKAVKALEAIQTKGMCYYSREYDIYIGGPPHGNSMFKIVSGKED